MMTKFNELCKKLDIAPSHPKDEDVDKLRQWCEMNISTDIHFSGDVLDCFNSYQNLATEFLDKIQPNVQSHNLTKSLSFFNGMTPLQLVADKGLNVYLNKLQPSHEQINTCVNKAVTLLHVAAVHGNLHTTEDLLSLGADPGGKNTKSGSILFSTLILPIDHDEHMIKNKQEIYILLSKFSKDILKERNESGDNILHIMSIYGYDELVKELLSQSEELAFISNNLGHYPIHSAILNGQDECVQRLMSVPNVPKLTDAKGRNALHYAAKYGNKNMLEICSKYTTLIDSTDKREQTPLILAVIANNIVTVKELINFGAAVNNTDDIHRSALHYAVESNNVDIVNLLLSSKDIDVNIYDNDSKTPLDLLQISTPENDKISQFLIKK